MKASQGDNGPGFFFLDLSFEGQEVVDHPEVGAQVIGDAGDGYGGFPPCYGDKREDLIPHPFVEGGPGVKLPDQGSSCLLADLLGPLAPGTEGIETEEGG